MNTATKQYASLKVPSYILAWEHETGTKGRANTAILFAKILDIFNAREQLHIKMNGDYMILTMAYIQSKLYNALDSKTIRRALDSLVDGGLLYHIIGKNNGIHCLKINQANAELCKSKFSNSLGLEYVMIPYALISWQKNNGYNMDTALVLSRLYQYQTTNHLQSEIYNEYLNNMFLNVLTDRQIRYANDILSRCELVSIKYSRALTPEGWKTKKHIHVFADKVDSILNDFYAKFEQNIQQVSEVEAEPVQEHKPAYTVWVPREQRPDYVPDDDDEY